jgi:hypothetical protein
MNEPRFSNAELKVQALASRRANAQLLRVPWPRFRWAYEEYPRWQSLALWSRAVIATKGRVPSTLLTTLQERCPGFIEDEAPSPEPELLAFHLLEWVHNQRFRCAKRQGWLDALTFYGVRHLRSESAWAYWERCENEWSGEKPNVFPSFVEWWDAALQMKLLDKASYSQVAKAVEASLDWEALVLWLRPLFVSSLKLPPHVISEVNRRCPGILGSQNSSPRRGSRGRSTIWRHFIDWGKDHCLTEAEKAGWLDTLLQRVRSHPRHVRIVTFGKHWAKGKLPPQYPSLRQWRQAADRYIEAVPK